MDTIDHAALTQDVSRTIVDRSSETALVERAKLGDHDAFAALVDHRLPTTLRTVMAILGNEADARDATQAIFIRAWTGMPTLRDAERFGPWFGRIVVNTCRSSLRGRRRRLVREIHVGSLPDGGEGLPTTNHPHDQQTADLDVLGRAFDRLTDDERTVLWLHHYEELSLAEIADRLGTRTTTVKSRLFTARRALERAIEAEER
ncbi:MAG: RNA polymerase sigma factor [Chloroflexota bacterium]